MTTETQVAEAKAPPALPKTAGRIIELRASNVKRVKAVAIRPGDGPVVLGGANGAGKSSVLDSIWYALGGKKGIPEDVVRHGADTATIELDLGGLLVKRTITRKGGGTLTVTSSDGTKYTSPQTIIDQLVGHLAFDPLAFARMSPKEQAQTLCDITGLDFGPLDAQRETLCQERLNTGREAKNLRGLVKSLPYHEDAPSDEVSVADLLEQRKRAEARATDRRRMLGRVDAYREALTAADKEIVHARLQIEQWQKYIAQYEAEMVRINKNIADLLAQVKTNEDAGHEDVAEIDAKIAGSEAINQQVRENVALAKATVRLMDSETRGKDLNLQIQAVEESKREMLANAQLPIAGLRWDSTHVDYKGSLLCNAAQSEQLRISTAVGLHQRGTAAPLCIREGCLLDEEHLAMVLRMIDEGGAQAWIERVGTGAECTVIIEDGMVVEEDEAEKEQGDG